MITSGGLSGGISSSIAGGNFWSGVREGLITSGLNAFTNSIVEVFEQSAKKDPTRVNKSKPTDVKEGDVLNYHNDGDSLDLWARQSKPKKGVVEIHDHASPDGTRYYDKTTILDLGNELYLKSPTWKNMIDNGVEIELHLYACTTGADCYDGTAGFAQTLSKFYPKVTVKAPTDYWNVIASRNIKTQQVTKLHHGYTPGVWKYFKNGKEIN